jgi:hypothetical protein
LILLGITEVISHRYSERSDELSAKQQEDTKIAHEHAIAELQLEAAKANKEAESLRAANLELENAVSPRVLEQSKTAETLSKFAGVPFVVLSPSDFEPKRTAGQIRFVLLQAKWARFTEPLNLPPFPFFDGVSVHVMGIISKPDDPAKAAAVALVLVLNENGITAKEGVPLFRFDAQGHPISPQIQPSLNSPNVVVVEVGPKPLPESLKINPPFSSNRGVNSQWGNIAE